MRATALDVRFRLVTFILRVQTIGESIFHPSDRQAGIRFITNINRLIGMITLLNISGSFCAGDDELFSTQPIMDHSPGVLIPPAQYQSGERDQRISTFDCPHRSKSAVPILLRYLPRGQS